MSFMKSIRKKLSVRPNPVIITFVYTLFNIFVSKLYNLGIEADFIGECTFKKIIISITLLE